MDQLKLALDVFNTISPLGLAAGLAYIVYLLVRNRRETTTASKELTGNHLHELPAMADTLRRIESNQTAVAAALLGQLADIRESLAHVKAKLNGK